MKIVELGDEAGYIRVDKISVDDLYEKWDIVQAYYYDKVFYYIVMEVDKSAGPFHTRYGLWKLNISKYWPIKQIQLWALRKAFKNEII